MSSRFKTFKFGASVLFAIVSFLIVMIAGLLKDVRYLTIFWRSLLAFFVAGGIAYLTIFILEFKGIINFDVIKAEEGIGEVEETSDEEQTEGEDEEAEGEEAAEGEGGGFKPLNADNLQRVAS